MALLRGRHRGVIVSRLHAGEGEVAVEAVERLAHVAQLARVLLDASVGKALEERGEAEPLDLVGGGAVLVDVLLGVLGKAGEKLGRLLGLTLEHEALGPLQLVRHLCLDHLTSSRQGAAHAC